MGNKTARVAILELPKRYQAQALAELEQQEKSGTVQQAQLTSLADDFKLPSKLANHEAIKNMWIENISITEKMLEDPDTTKQNRPCLLHEVIELGEFRGWQVYHTKNSFGSQKGFPDLVLARAGSGSMFVELKRYNTDLKPDQVIWRDVLLASGSIWYLWRPSDWSKIVEKLW